MKKIILIFLFIPSFLFSQWIQQSVPAGINNITTIDFANVSIGAAGGRFDLMYGRAIYTTNSGANWYLSQVPDSLYSIVKIQLIDNNTGYLTGAYYHFPINNAGYNIKKVYSSFSPLSNKGLDGRMTAFADSPKGIFLKTTNGGKIWFTQGTLPSNVYFLLGMRFINSNTGFATASLDPNSSVKYSVLKTTNGGLNWNNVFTLDSCEIESVYSLDGINVFVAGWKQFNAFHPIGIILKSSNGGNNWSLTSFPSCAIFFDINFTNPSTGFAVTYDSLITALIYKTTNTGINWTKMSFQNPLAVYYGIEFVGGTGKGIAFGNKISPYPSFSDLLISRTTDYGTSWTNYQIPDTFNALNCSSLVDANNWFIAGGTYNNGIIYKSTNGGAPIGIESISSEIPNRFSLSQNYPNPFNPSTKVKFSIPLLRGVSEGRGVLVRLSVYDALGKKIAVLVNEQLKPGTYEVQWDGSNYTSGVYFYKLVVSGAEPLTTQGFCETKKMVLVK